MGYSNSQNSFGHTALGTEYCPGFRDVYGQWNNGFYCPKWGSQDLEYCCGPTNHRYCCPKAETLEKLHSDQATQLTLLIGLAVGTFVLLVGTTVLSCYFCRCCWAYKRRKRTEGSLVLPEYPGHSQDCADPASYAVCPPGMILPEFMRSAVHYTRDAPPPYPGYPPDAPAIDCKEFEPQTQQDTNPEHGGAQLRVSQQAPSSPQSQVLRPSMRKVCAGRSTSGSPYVGREHHESSTEKLTIAPEHNVSDPMCQLCSDECRGYPQFQYSGAKPRTKVNPLKKFESVPSSQQGQTHPSENGVYDVLRRGSIESKTRFC